jgi:hypothetical protein
MFPDARIASKITAAELLTLSMMRALTGHTIQTRWLR